MIAPKGNAENGKTDVPVHALVPWGVAKRLGELAKIGIVGETVEEVARYMLIRALDDEARAMARLQKYDTAGQ